MLPVNSTVLASEGNTAELSVFAAADPPLSSDEIMWFSPRGELIVSEDRMTFDNSSKTLVLRNVSLEDSGSYRVEIRREVVTFFFRTLAETNITLDVHGEWNLTSSCNLTLKWNTFL